MKEIEFYKSNEILSNRYYQIPQELFESPLYKDKLNSDSKILYAFLLDRLTLSQKNHWIDENDNIYLTKFFDSIGPEETKRYFEESYKFVCNYKNLGEQNIISAVVHLDEGTPHMHLAYIPVVHAKDKEGNAIDKICCRDFWKGQNSYRDLQNAFFEYITSKVFELEIGLPFEETGRKHKTIQDFKQITNFDNTKKVLGNITLELPEVPKISDIKKDMLNRDEKIFSQIIKPKDNLILKLHKENLALTTELSKQANFSRYCFNLRKKAY